MLVYKRRAHIAKSRLFLSSEFNIPTHLNIYPSLPKMDLINTEKVWMLYQSSMDVSGKSDVPTAQQV